MSETLPNASLSAAVLTGGQSSRMGTDKALLLIDGSPVLEHILRRLRGVASDIIVAGDRPGYHRFGVPVYADRFPGAGPLAGLETALHHAMHESVLVVGCDMPFLHDGLLQAMAARPFDGDALVPFRIVDGHARPEPLHAIYRKQCLPLVAELLAGGRRSMQRLLDELQVTRLDEEWLRRHDPALTSFTNVNTPEEARRAGIGPDVREETTG